jgi:CRISPR-associated protein Cas2
MPWLICYDIENDSLRLKVSNALLKYGFLRIQKSVFAGRMKKHHLKNLRGWLRNTISPKLQPGDKILLLRIPDTALEKGEWAGDKPPEWDLLVSPPDVLIL